MSLTSARFSDVWPSSAEQPPSVSARAAHVAETEGTPSSVYDLLNEMHRDMTQRTHVLVIIIIVLTVMFMQRIGRLEQRLMIQSIGAPPPHWW